MVAVMDVLSRIKLEHSELVAAAEQVLLAMANDPRSVNEEDKIVFKWLSWTEKDIARELGRVQQLQRWKPQAGSSVEYAEAVELHAALSKSVPKKTSELQAKIDELQAKIDDENSKLNQAQRRLDSMDHARKMLREIIPKHVRKAFDDELARIRTSETADRMRELQSRKRTVVSVLQNLSTVSASNVAEVRLHAKAVGLEGVVPPPSEFWNQNRYINETIWMEYLDRLRAELPSIEAELSQLEMSVDEWLADAESILDFYLEAK
jgi:DNA repair exonuclease SbcCD ATPase subunit